MFLSILKKTSQVNLSLARISRLKDKALLFLREDIVESALYVNKKGSQYMVLKKCGMAERVVNGFKKRGVDVITY